MPRAKNPASWAGWIDQVGPDITRALDEILPPESQQPKSVHRAMRYSVFSGGKRIRPALAVLGFELAGGKGPAGIILGAALELIHTFSLIHDDLPCMDDDDFRRGRPSCHKKFGEASAVLAGDALQVLAFETLAGLPVTPARRVRILQEVTEAVGTAGVIGGQVVDIESEGVRISPATLRWMHLHKTGTLLRCTLTSGAILGGAGPALHARLYDFGTAFGLLFQIVDDLLDELGTRKVLGRRAGRDRIRGKATYPRILGLERSRTALAAAVEDARAKVPARGSQGAIFDDLIEVVVGRLPADWRMRPAAGGSPAARKKASR